MYPFQLERITKHAFVFQNELQCVDKKSEFISNIAKVAKLFNEFLMKQQNRIPLTLALSTLPFNQAGQSMHYYTALWALGTRTRQAIGST